MAYLVVLERAMIRGWHFTGNTLSDGRPIPRAGQWLEHDGKLVICKSGLHASLEPFDALTYAPWPFLHLVDCDGEIIKSTDKLVCSRRRIVASMDATELLRYFARMQALSVVHLWDAPDTMLDYLMTGDATIREAAWNAAWATWAAANAARPAVNAACAARAAADAARNAAWSARAAKDFDDLVYECFERWL